MQGNCFATHLLNVSYDYIQHSIHNVYKFLFVWHHSLVVWVKQPQDSSALCRKHESTNRGPILAQSGQGAVTLWPQHTLTEREREKTSKRERERREEEGYGKQEQKVKTCQDISVRGTRTEQKPDAKTETAEVWAADWIRQEGRPDLPLHKYLWGKVLLFKETLSASSLKDV